MTRKEMIRQDSNKLAIKRAQSIGAAAWYECVDQVLTEEEKKEIQDLWKTMPGSSFWTSAFFVWYDRLPQTPVAGFYCSVHFEDGNRVDTRVNGTWEEIRRHYIGQEFQFGDTWECPRDHLVKAVSVVFHSAFTTTSAGERVELRAYREASVLVPD